MNWESLFNMQKGLDTYITENHKLENEDLFEEIILAILVELGELANETRCFKFWSTKERSETAVILEEYVDNIHFLMSVGLKKGYEFSMIDVGEVTLKETSHFLEVFHLCLTFYKDDSEGNYQALFKSYLELADILGFSEADIQKAYYDKNEVNYQRQQSGY